MFFAAVHKPIPAPTGAGVELVPGSPPTLIEPDETAPALEPRGTEGVSLRFWQTDARDPDMQGALDALDSVSAHVLGHLLADSQGPPIEAPKARVTVAEMITVLPAVDQSVQLAFRRCFAALEDVSRAFGNALNPPYSAVELADVSPIVLFAAPSKEDGTGDQLSMYVISGSIPEDYMGADDLDADAVSRFSVHLLRLRQGDPFSLCSERAHAARVAAERSDFGGTVLNAAVASEILLDATLSSMMWEERTDPETASRTLSRSVSQWLGSELPTRVGGNWAQNGNGPVAAWRHHIANVRNRVVHRGYRPSESESRSALDSFADLNKHLRVRLHETRLRFPRTTLMLLGEPGVERLGGWTKQMRERIRELDEDPDSWVGEHVAWRDEVDALG